MHLHRSDENRFEVQFSHRTTETAMDNPPNQSFSAHQWTCFIMIDPLVKSPLLASTFCLMHPPTWIRQCRCAVSPSDDTAIISWRQQLKRRWGQGIGYTKHLRRKIGRLKVEVPKNGEIMKYTYSNFMYRWLWYIVMQDVDSLKIVQEKFIGSIVDFRSLCELMHASLCQHPC